MHAAAHARDQQSQRTPPAFSATNARSHTHLGRGLLRGTCASFLEQPLQLCFNCAGLLVLSGGRDTRLGNERLALQNISLLVVQRAKDWSGRWGPCALRRSSTVAHDNMLARLRDLHGYDYKWDKEARLVPACLAGPVGAGLEHWLLLLHNPVLLTSSCTLPYYPI